MFLIVLPKDPLWNIPAKSGCSFSGKEVKNILANQRSGWLSWITDHSKKKQHFLRAHGGTFLATLYEVELGKKSKKYLGKLKLRAAIMDFKVTTLL